MEIKINDDYTMEKDLYCWNLHYWYEGKKKGGGTTRKKKTTYHANLLQVCNEIADKEAGNCTSLEEIKELLTVKMPQLIKDMEIKINGNDS